MKKLINMSLEEMINQKILKFKEEKTLSVNYLDYELKFCAKNKKVVIDKMNTFYLNPVLKPISLTLKNNETINFSEKRFLKNHIFLKKITTHLKDKKAALELHEEAFDVAYNELKVIFYNMIEFDLLDELYEQEEKIKFLHQTIANIR